MTVWMDFLLCNLQTVPHIVQMIHVAQPYPGDVSFLGHPCAAVPLRLLPQLIGFLQTVRRKRFVHVCVHRFIGIGGILSAVAFFRRMVDIVQFHGCMGAPAPHQRLGKGIGIGHVPARALNCHLYAKTGALIGQIRRKRLPHRVIRLIHQRKGSAHPVFFPDAVLAFLPARFLQNAHRLIRIVCHLGSLVVPGQFVTDTVGRRPVTIQHVLYHFLPVDPDVDGPADGDVAGHIVSHRHTVFVMDGHSWQIDSPVVHTLHPHKAVTLQRLIRIGGGSVRHIHLSGHGCRERRVLLHEKDGDPLHFHLSAVIIRIGLQNHLLSPVPLPQNVTAGANGIASIVFIIGMLRHDSHHRHGIGPDGKRPVHVKFHRYVIHRHRALQHGKIIHAAVFGTEIIGKRHVRSGQLLSVRKIGVIPDGHCPQQTVLRHRVIHSQIHPDLQIRRSGGQRALNQRLMHMLSRSPAVNRIKTRLRLRGRRHGHDDRSFLCRLLCGRLRGTCRFRCCLFRVRSLTSAENSGCQKQDCAERRCHAFSFHSFLH